MIAMTQTTPPQSQREGEKKKRYFHTTRWATIREFRKEMPDTGIGVQFTAVILVFLEDHDMDFSGTAEYEIPVVFGPMKRDGLDIYLNKNIYDHILPSPKKWRPRKNRENMLLSEGFKPMADQKRAIGYLSKVPKESA